MTSSINLLLSIAVLLNFILGLFIYLRNPKRKADVFYALGILSAAFWTFCMIMFRISDGPSLKLWSLLLWSATVPIVLFFLYFSLNFPEEKPSKTNLFLHFLIIAFSLITLFVFIFKNGIFKEILFIEEEKGFIFNLPSFYFYCIYIISYFTIAFIILFKKYFQSVGLVKIQLLFIILGTLASAVAGVIFGLFLPMIGDFKFYWLSPGLTIIMAISIFYAIVKHHLLNIKIIATELFSAILIIILFVKFLLSESLQQFILNGIIMAAFLGFSYLLIKSVLKEVKTREEMEELAKELEEANVRLKKLDEAKSEFITIASHQLRSPITAIKGYSSMMLEGSFGRVPIRAKKMLKRVLQSTNRLMFLIDDFLNLSQIERGKMQYNFEKTDLKEMVSEIVDEFKTIAAREKKDIEVSLKIAETEDFIAMVDSNKIQQVFNNLIDNAIKYTEKGFVKINLYADDENGRIFFEVLDSGIGMDKETEALIFQKFTRAGENIFQVHTEGLGLGLYVSKEIIKAHNGKIYAESDGPGKGSTFFVELPRGDVNPPNTSPEHDYQKHDKRIEEFIKKI